MIRLWRRRSLKEAGLIGGDPRALHDFRGSSQGGAILRVRGASSNNDGGVGIVLAVYAGSWTVPRFVWSHILLPFICSEFQY